MSAVRKWIQLVDSIKGMGIESAVINAYARAPALASEVMDRVGSWEAAEVEVRVLQRLWADLCR